MIRELFERLKNDKPRLAPFRVWQAYAVLDEYKDNQPASELTALFALIRRVAAHGISSGDTDRDSVEPLAACLFFPCPRLPVPLTIY